MPLRHQLRDYFLFSRKDRIAVMLLLVIIGFALCMPYVVRPVTFASGDDDSAWVMAVNRLLSSGGDGSSIVADRDIPDSLKNSGDRYNNAAAVKLFPFDPNTLATGGWRQLGLKDRTIETILKYRSKGGQFRKPADLARIYGMSAELAENLMPWVQIKGTGSAKSWPRSPENEQDYAPRPAAAKFAAGTADSGSAWSRRKPRAYVKTDLNKADTTALIALPCIGSKLAMRIIQFREKLGGFYSVDQLRETYGITDSSFEVLRPWLVADPLDCRLITVNDVSLDQLKLHPYIRFDLARTIIAWRQEHGGFQSLEDLKRVSALPPDTYERILPYLRL